VARLAHDGVGPASTSSTPQPHGEHWCAKHDVELAERTFSQRNECHNCSDWFGSASCDCTYTDVTERYCKACEAEKAAERKAHQEEEAARRQREAEEAPKRKPDGSARQKKQGCTRRSTDASISSSVVHAKASRAERHPRIHLTAILLADTSFGIFRSLFALPLLYYRNVLVRVLGQLACFCLL